MSQKTQNAPALLPVAVVGRSPLFPVAAAPRAFWPGLLGLKGLMSGLTGGQWPMSEFFTAQDLKNLKWFVLKSGLLTGVPAEGFEIPPDVVPVTTVLPAVALFLAKKALENTRSFGKGGIPAPRVRVALETRARPQTLAQKDLADIFARHYGFGLCPIDDASPLRGALNWVAAAVRELQSDRTDLVVAGSTDAVHALGVMMKEGAPAEGSRNGRYREGLQMFTLRRLADAERDGDEIFGIITDVDASTIGFSGRETPAGSPQPAESPAASPAVPPAAPAIGRTERLARFSRLQAKDIVEDTTGSCLNLPYNVLPENDTGVASLDWKRLRKSWIDRTGSHRFFHDLIGALCGTFISRVVIQSPAAFAAVADRPVVFLANHQIGLESPLFMAMAYGLTGLPIQAVAKPDHVNAWLAFLLEFAKDSLGGGHPFRLMYFDRQNPQGLIDSLKNEDRRDASLLVHVEGTRSLTADQPVTKMSSIFLDMPIDKNIPIVPVRFVGGLPAQANNDRLDFPYDNGKQDYLIGTPILPEELKKLAYGQRPKFVMDRINTLGPAKGEDVLLPPSKEFGAKTRFFVETFGFPKMQAMLFAILQRIDEPCEETALLIKAVTAGKLDPASNAIPPVLKNFLTHVKTKFA
ncbi:MAG TPA: hypothetical protein PLP29_12355 [Candidatus Ozemobacteraceae bacterium]|nr:hypothetical protein [Candidatus Ozemobacteraceae bacterium]